MFGMALALNARAVAQATTASGTGIEVQGAQVVDVLFPKATSGNLQGSTDGGANFTDIADSGFTALATDSVIISLMKPRFDHIRAEFAGSGASAILIGRDIRVAPPTDIDRDLVFVLEDPVAGTP